MKTIYAKQADLDTIYLSRAKDPSLVRILGQDEKHALAEVWIRGYGWKSMTMRKEALLQLPDREAKRKHAKDLEEINMKTKTKAKAKAAAPKKNRMPKVGDGKSAPRVKVEGFDLREYYRIRISSKAAAACAAGTEDTCKCRCGGSLHGKNHKPWFEAESKLFEKSANGAIYFKEVLKLIKKFGGKSLVKKSKAKAKPKAKKSAPKKRKKK